MRRNVHVSNGPIIFEIEELKEGEEIVFQVNRSLKFWVITVNANGKRFYRSRVDQQVKQPNKIIV